MFKKIFLMIVLSISIAIGGEELIKGDKAPDFKLPDENGDIHSLADYEGKIVALFFYPKDDTPGCTAEACNLRDNYSELLEAGVEILGVSYDEPESHIKFKKKHNLPFHLLADTDKEVAKSYNAKSLIYGWMVPNRITYLIDEKGFILSVIEEVNTEKHAEQILSILKNRNEG